MSRNRRLPLVNRETDFEPNWVIPPGASIQDAIDERFWTQQQLADRLGISLKHTNRLIRGKVELNAEIALKLENVLEISADFWLAREADFREGLARMKHSTRLEGWVGWLDELPVKELRDLKLISNYRIVPKHKPRLVDEFLQFFNVASPEQWRKFSDTTAVCFRAYNRHPRDTGAIMTWLQIGSRKAEQAYTEVLIEKDYWKNYDESEFRRSLDEIRKLTTQSPEVFQKQMCDLCLRAGVILVFTPTIRRAGVIAAFRWLDKVRPLIQLSLGGKTNDKFWFTFFHEAAHLLLHGKRKKLIFLDERSTASSTNQEEREANDWAAKFLIPTAFDGRLKQLKSEASIMEFAHEIGMHPGIVVGKLQHERYIRHSQMNDLKEKCDFSDQ